ncbi:hypothetical protein AB1N83_014315, partial [Pleurotus pulmonarius]
ISASSATTARRTPVPHICAQRRSIWGCWR